MHENDYKLGEAGCPLKICDGSQTVPGPTLEDSDRQCPCALDDEN